MSKINSELSPVPDQYTDTSSLWWDERTKVSMMADKHIENALVKLQGLGKTQYDSPAELRRAWIEILVTERAKRAREKRATKVD